MFPRSIELSQGVGNRTRAKTGRVSCPNENRLSNEAKDAMSTGGQTYFYPCFSNHQRFRVRDAPEEALIHVKTDIRRNPRGAGTPASEADADAMT